MSDVSKKDDALFESKVDENIEAGRRDFLYVATACFALVGGAAVVWPLVDQMNPDSTVRALSSVVIDLSRIEVGQSITIEWRGNPVFVRRRTSAEIATAQAVPLDELIDPERDQDRVKRSQWLIVQANCTHLGCVPLGNKGEYGGWLCPCHGSQFDVSGRVRRGPAPTNLVVPDYNFLSDTVIRIGKEA